MHLYIYIYIYIVYLVPSHNLSLLLLSSFNDFGNTLIIIFRGVVQIFWTSSARKRERERGRKRQKLDLKCLRMKTVLKKIHGLQYIPNLEEAKEDEDADESAEVGGGSVVGSNNFADNEVPCRL